MKTPRKLLSNDSAIELPINIVVMLVVGMVALAALIAIIPPPTKNMSVNVDQAGLSSTTLAAGNTILVDSTIAANPFDVIVEISAKDPDGYPVRGANVVLRGLGGAATGVTDDTGKCTLTAGTSAGGAPISLGANQNEGTMDLKVTANGFYDYEKTNAVMIVRTS